MTRARSCLFVLCLVALAPAAHAQNFASERMLNPQPLPPRWARTLRPGEEVTLNPQPLPPRESSQVMALGGTAMLNPQPLPPGPDRTRALRRDPEAARRNAYWRLFARDQN